MRRRIGILLALVFYCSGLVGLFRWRMRRSGRRLIIMNYHRASGGNLRSHMLYLRRHYRILYLEEALEWLYAPSNEQEDDRRTVVALTFDDGYHDNYIEASALARELQVPITIFVIPGYLDNGKYFWWCESGRIVRRATVKDVTVEERRYQLDLAEDRMALTRLINDRLHYATSIAEREAFLEEMYQKLAPPTALMDGDLRDQPLTWGEVLKMQESTWVSFGSHTMHHPVLSYLADPAEVRYEIEESRRSLQQRLGREIKTFAYPIGHDQHISDSVVEAVRGAGYSWAVTADTGFNTPGTNRLLLKRVQGDLRRHWLVLAAEISGIWQYLAPLWKSILGH